MNCWIQNQFSTPEFRLSPCLRLRLLFLVSVFAKPLQLFWFREDKLFESECSLYKKKDQIIQLTDDESLDAVGRGVDEGEWYFSVGSGEKDDVEVVSIEEEKFCMMLTIQLQGFLLY